MSRYCLYLVFNKSVSLHFTLDIIHFWQQSSVWKRHQNAEDLAHTSYATSDGVIITQLLPEEFRHIGRPRKMWHADLDEWFKASRRWHKVLVKLIGK